MDMVTDARSHTPSFGCAKIAGIGCAAMVVLAIVAGIVVYYKGHDLLRAGGAAVANMAAVEMMDQFEIPAAERDAAMVPVREFTEKVKKGEVSTEQIGAVAKAFVEGPAFAAIAARGFDAKYMKKSSLGADEQAAGRTTLSRFAHGISSGAVPHAALEGLKDIVTVSGKGADGKDDVDLKDALTDDEVRAALAHMKSSADGGGVEQREFAIDLPAEIRSSIKKGMSSAP
jgi:hypothetical protein